MCGRCLSRDSTRRLPETTTKAPKISTIPLPPAFMRGDVQAQRRTGGSMRYRVASIATLRRIRTAAGLPPPFGHPLINAGGKGLVADSHWCGGFGGWYCGTARRPSPTSEIARNAKSLGSPTGGVFYPRRYTPSDLHCHCEAAGRGNLLVFSGDNLKTKGKHRTPRPPHL